MPVARRPDLASRAGASRPVWCGERRPQGRGSGTAWIGDLRRFPHAKQLAAYAGLVPTVRQSGISTQFGRITKQGSPALRATLVQAAHVLSLKHKCPVLQVEMSAFRGG